METSSEAKLTPIATEVVKQSRSDDKKKKEAELDKERKAAVIRKVQAFAPEAIDTIVDIMRFGKNAERLKAATKLLEYAVGDPRDKKTTDVITETVLTPEEYEIINSEDNEEAFQKMIEDRYAREQ